MHSILVIAYHMISTGEIYHGLDDDYFSQGQTKEAYKRRLIAQLECMGHNVSVEPAT